MIIQHFTSDHVPICIISGEQNMPTKRLFEFEKWWIEHVEVWSLIKETWTSPLMVFDVARIWIAKLRSLRKSLLQWEKIQHSS